jgi:hypothetical protein
VATRVTFGKGLIAAAPGSAEGALVVADIEAAHHELLDRGVEVSEVWHGPPFPPRHGSAAQTPSTRATARSAPSAIPTATRGWSRRSRRGSPAGSEVAGTAFASSAVRLGSALKRTAALPIAVVPATAASAERWRALKGAIRSVGRPSHQRLNLSRVRTAR